MNRMERAERALRESEANYRTLVESLPIGIFRLASGQNGKFLMMNRTFLNMTGFESEAQLSVHTLADLAANPAEFTSISETLLEAGFLKEVELLLNKKDGTQIWGLFTGRVLRDESSGEVAYLDCTIEDITERKRVETELLHQAEELAVLHAVSLDITAPHDRESLLYTVASRAARLLHAPGGVLYLSDDHRQEVRLLATSLPYLQENIGLALRYGEGVAGFVAQSGKALILDNSSTWSGATRLFNQEQPYEAVLSVPMSWQGKVTGVLQVADNRETRHFTQTDLELLTLFANQAAIAIENAQLLESEARRAAQLESLRQASLSLTSSLDLEAVLNAILAGTFNLFPGVQDAHIFLYSPENGGKLRFGTALWASGKRGKVFSEPRPYGLTNTVARQGEAIYVPDIHSHPLFVGAPADWRGSIIGLPLKVSDRVIGVMNVAHSQAGAFKPEDVRLLSLLSDQAAIAIENAHLFEQATTERRHLGLLYDVVRELGTSLDADKILKHAVTLTCQALGGMVGEAFAYLPAEKQLSIRALYGLVKPDLSFYQENLEIPLGTGLCGWVAQHRQPVIVPDVSQDSRWLQIPSLDEDVHAALSAPIVQEERLWGVLTVLHHQVNIFHDDHLDLMQAICRQIGLALSNAERYQQVQQLTETLTAHQKRLEDLLEHLPMGVLLLDSGYRLLVANPLGRDFAAALHLTTGDTDQVNASAHTLQEMITSHKEALPIEIEVNEPFRRVYEAQAGPIGPRLGDETTFWVLTIRDVTQERENQARIQMQERLATVGQLAAGIAHDFNNIMASIMVYTDLLRRDKNLYSTSRERLNIIHQQVQNAASLIRQILDFSRRSVLEQSHLDLLPFIKELDKLLARVLPETIRLELTYQPDSYLVNADPTSLQQVFMNLALNARDAMPKGGFLKFEMGRLHLNPGQHPPCPDLSPGDWIWVAIQDTGCGIQPDVLPHIYEPFFTTKPIGQGTGLGLSQAYGIIKQHEGHIDVTSQPGNGTRFVIYLPALPIPSAEAGSPEGSTEYEGGDKIILIAEDDPTTREALQTLLEVQKYRVLTAADGLEAVQIYEQQKQEISLVVSDVVMPKMGGVTMYRALKARFPALKILFITGHPLQEEDRILLEDGRVPWLQKPFSISDFLEAIGNLLND
jgi:PAS domain S-box-containing protein